MMVGEQIGFGLKIRRTPSDEQAMRVRTAAEEVGVSHLLTRKPQGLSGGEKQRVATNNAGGFTFKVKPGKYQVQLTLREGEVLIKKPSVISVNRSDVDAHADFVLGTARVARPRRPQRRGDDGLGSPSA